MVVDDAMGGSNGGATNGRVVVSSVVVVVWLTGAGSGPQPDSKAVPVISARASPWLQCDRFKFDFSVMVFSI